MSTDLNVESIVAQIRSRIAEEITRATNATDRNGSLPMAAVDPNYRKQLDEDSRYFLDLDAQIETSAATIGGKPPVPPTLRGRFGSWAIGILRHLLWWYTAPIQQTFDLLNRRNREEATRYRQMRGQVLSLIERIQQVGQKLQTSGVKQENEGQPWAYDLQKLREGLLQKIDGFNNGLQEVNITGAEIESFRNELGSLSETVRTHAEARQAFALAASNRLDQIEQNLNEHVHGLKDSFQQLQTSSLASLRTLSEGVRAQAEMHDIFSAAANSQIDQLRGQINALQANLQELKVSHTTSDSMRSQLAEKVSDAANLLWGRLPVLETRLDVESEERTTLSEQTNNRLTRLEKNVTEGITSLAGRASQLALSLEKQRSELLLQENRVSMFLRDLRSQLPKSLTEAQLHTMTEAAQDRISALYSEFENVFRGPRDEIEERQKVYLPWLNQAGAGTSERPVLDLGCGRGEWLGLLAKHNLTGCGVDLNLGMINRCIALGLNVVKQDALVHLRNLPDKSLGAITSFHMVEHLSFDTVLAIVDEALRVLQSGGLLIFETPNPQNALVGSQTFWIDPTHIRPIPSQTLRFFMEARGFCNLEILNLQPYAEAIRLPEESSGLAKRFNDYFYGPQDYGIIGHRP